MNIRMATLEDVETLHNLHFALNRHRHSLQPTNYQGKSMDEEWDEHFEEVLVNLTRSEYLEDGLLFGSREEIKDFYENCKGEVEKIGQRVAEIEKGRNQRNSRIKR